MSKMLVITISIGMPPISLVIQKIAVLFGITFLWLAENCTVTGIEAKHYHILSIHKLVTEESSAAGHQDGSSWSTWPERKGWRNGSCSASRRGRFRLTQHQPSSTYKEAVETMGWASSWKCVVGGWKTLGTNWNERLRLDTKRTFFMVRTVLC